MSKTCASTFVLDKLRKTSRIQLEMIRAIDNEIVDARSRLLQLAVQRDKLLIAYSETSRHINEWEMD
jgi:hypothetical protein